MWSELVEEVLSLESRTVLLVGRKYYLVLDNGKLSERTGVKSKTVCLNLPEGVS